MVPRIRTIGSAYKHIKRYPDIVTVLVKHGFGDLITNNNLLMHVDLGKKLHKRQADVKIGTYSRWKRIRLALVELGPTFVKVGQIMSNRPDLLPQKLIVELEKLQDLVASFPTAEARSLIEEELGVTIPLVAYFHTAAWQNVSGTGRKRTNRYIL